MHQTTTNNDRHQYDNSPIVYRFVNENNSDNNNPNDNDRNNDRNELKQFLSDHEARTQLIDLREKVNIRDLAQSYDVSNKKKKKQKLFSYSPTVFLLSKTKNNRVPIPGHPK